ncbi:MAG: hypothetical protein JW737_05555, partial [Acidobacteria bacterium]|nr:hypothetical protein [Acidobacteriota bacterium]
KADEFIIPNGIAIDDIEKNIFLAATGIGIYRINLQTKEYKLISNPSEITATGIDGMYFYKDSLICIQNSLNRVVRIHLNKTGETAIKLEIIEKENPNFILPTTGTIVDDCFYFIANSQIYSMGQDRKLLPVEQLKDIIILKAKLN